MAWPEDEILDIKVEAGGLTPGLTWTDITQYVYRESVKIDRGTPDEANRVRPSGVSFLLNNRDGRFSPRNPNGPYYGNFQRGTPLLVSVMGGDRFLDVPSSGRARVSDTAQIDITGDIDARVDATLYNWNAGDDDQVGGADVVELIAKYDTSGDQRSWRLTVFDGRLFYSWSTDGTLANTTQVGTGDADIITPSNDRLAVRVTHDVDDGSGNNVVTFYQAPSIDSTEWMPIGDPVVTAGTTSIFNSTAPLTVGENAGTASDAPNGKFWAARVYDGINGTLAAGVDFRAQTVGDTSLTGDAGLTWEVEGGAAISNQHNRFRGQVVAWPSRWKTGGFDVWVPLQAKGLIRRHNQGTNPLDSALRRRIPSDPNVLAYWPLEDGEDSTSFASGLAGGTPMSFTGDITPAAHTGPDGSDSLPTFNGGGWRGAVPSPASFNNEWAVEWVVNLQSITATKHSIQRITTAGTALDWYILVSTSGVHIEVYDQAGTQIEGSVIGVGLSDQLNEWARYRLSAVQNGGNIDWTFTNIPIGGIGGFASGSFAGTIGRVTGVLAEGTHDEIDGFSWGHLGVFNSDTVTVYDSADTGFTGENAVDRFGRLCDESGERKITSGSRQAGVQDMGPQRPDSLIDLLSEAAFADRGILVDTRDVADFTGFKFVGKSALYNQPPTVVVDYGGSDGLVAPLDPIDDDLYLRNSVTVDRELGSSFTLELTEGTLTPAEVGLYATDVTVNVESDGDLPDRAGWELHLGTWDEERYPTVSIKLQNAPHLIADVMALDVGSRIRIVNARDSSSNDWIPPGDIDLMVRGYREEMSQYRWEFEFQCVPARPWNVPLAGSLSWAHVTRAGTAGSELDEDLTTTENVITVRTTDAPTWTDSVSDVPFEWLVSGETMRVGNIGGQFNANEFFDSDVTGWTASGGAIAHSTAFVHPDDLASGSMLLTPDGVSAFVDAVSDLPAGTTVNEGGRYKAAFWAYSPTGHSDVKTSIQWYTSGDVFVSTSESSAYTIPPGEWTYLEDTFTAPATAAKAKARVRHGGTPAVSNVLYVWAVRVSRVKSSWAYDEFGRTLSDSWGVSDAIDTWTNSGGAATDYDVGSGYGSHTLTSVDVSRRSTIVSPSADFDMYVDVATDALATGGPITGGLIGRASDGDNLYQARLAFNTDQTVTLSLRKRVAGVETELDSFTTGLVHVAGTFYRLRFEASGTSLRAKAWPVDGSERPWQVEATDSSLTAADPIGVRSIVFTGNTNTNPQVRYDNFELANPQVFGVTRSWNGIVKSHSAGDAVTLYHPTIAAL